MKKPIAPSKTYLLQKSIKPKYDGDKLTIISLLDAFEQIKAEYPDATHHEVELCAESDYDGSLLHELSFERKCTNLNYDAELVAYQNELASYYDRNPDVLSEDQRLEAERKALVSSIITMQLPTIMGMMASVIGAHFMTEILKENANANHAEIRPETP